MTASFIAIITATALQAAGTGMVTGFRHIIPEGLDHVLLILALCLQSRDFTSLLVQVTLFTIAHSLTLGLAILGYVSVPERAVEIVVALSIAFVALESFLMRESGRRRLPLVFMVGLVHGLAFAHALPEGTVSRGDLLPHLLGYNVGIESGQLVVVVCAFLALAPLWPKSWYRQRVLIPACCLIALAGVGMAWSRIVA